VYNRKPDREVGISDSMMAKSSHSTRSRGCSDKKTRGFLSYLRIGERAVLGRNGWTQKKREGNGKGTSFERTVEKNVEKGIRGTKTSTRKCKGHDMAFKGGAEGATLENKSAS